MAFALAKKNLSFIDRMLRTGRFNNQSEIVREALRRMEADEMSYLVPPPLSKSQVGRIYGQSADDEKENAFGRAAFDAVRRAARKGK